MKRSLKGLAFISLLLILALVCLSSCDGADTNPDGGGGENPPEEQPVIYSLVLEADKTSLVRGDSVTLSAALKAEGKEDIAAEDVVYSITAGSEYATLTANSLTVLNSAPDGAEIKVKAREGATWSNELTLKVSVPAESISVSAGGATNILAGQSIVLSATVSPAGAQSDVVWTITEGADSAAISGNVLVVNAGAVTGKTVKVKATVGAISSEELTFTVGYPLEGLSISAIGSLNILAGSSAQVNVVVNPTNATNASYSLEFVNDCSTYATIIGNVITVSESAATGAKIEVKAVAGDVESNVISYTVGYPLTALTAQLSGSANVNPGNSAALSVALTPANATNGSYTWVITEGAEYAELVGNSISVKSGAAIGSIVKVKAVAGDISSNEITIVVGKPIESLAISSTAPAILDRGASYPLALSATPTDASLNAVEWVVSEGADYATVQNGMLFIASNTPAGTSVKLHAASGSISSNELSYTVGIELESIEISLNGSSNVDPDNSRVISVTLDPVNASDTTVLWVIDEGAEYATISNGVITVKENAPIGAEVTFHAEIVGVKSNSLTVTVGTPITEIVISTPASTDIVKGNSAELEVALTPSNASASLISWQVTAGAEYVSISANNNMTVSASAPTGTVIKVKAVFGDIESNELVFTVKATKEEINAERYFIGLSSSSVTVDKKGTSAPVVIGTITNANFDTVTDRNIVYEVVEGSSYLAVSQSGNNCSFEALGHGQATVRAYIPGTEASANIAVNVIVPPDAIAIPEVFRERTDIEYAFSMIDPDTNEAETLPFLPTIRGDKVCTDYKVTFIHNSGAASDDIAVYENGAITFKKTGKVTAVITSTSGSLTEASASYTFNINEGYNVHTFAELQKLVKSSSYTGQIINLVVLEKPVAQYETTYKYGYDIVPPSALYDLDAKYAHLGDDAGAAIVHEIIHGSSSEYGTTSNRIQAVNKSVWVNGNNHKIDGSQMRLFTQAEYAAYVAKYNKTYGAENLSSLFSAEPWTSSGEDIEGVTKDRAHTVKFYNIEVVGNCPVDYTGEKSGAIVIGCYAVGINVGAITTYTTDYYVTCDNLTVSAFKDGFKIDSVVGDSKISNIHAYNCYASGLRVTSSILTIENMTFGVCGACAIEISSDESSTAGVNENENTKITFAGTIDASTNLNAGDSVYFQNYTVGGYTVPQIVNLNVQQMMNENQRTHIMNENGQFNFVSLIFADLNTFAPNTSEVLYPAYQEGGIIDISELADTTDTEHQYVTMDIKVILGDQIVSAGTAIFYNMNYGK